MLQTLYLALADRQVAQSHATATAAELRAQLAGLGVSPYEQQLRELKQSTSWRVTAPLRAASDLVRKIRR
jgi:hypothetical protein